MVADAPAPCIAGSSAAMILNMYIRRLKLLQFKNISQIVLQMVHMSLSYLKFCYGSDFRFALKFDNRHRETCPIPEKMWDCKRKSRVSENLRDVSSWWLEPHLRPGCELGPARSYGSKAPWQMVISVMEICRNCWNTTSKNNCFTLINLHISF